MGNFNHILGYKFMDVKAKKMDRFIKHCLIIR